MAAHRAGFAAAHRAGAPLLHLLDDNASMLRLAERLGFRREAVHLDPRQTRVVKTDREARLFVGATWVAITLLAQRALAGPARLRE